MPAIKRNPKAPRQMPPEVAPEVRVQGAVEVAGGFTDDQARVESLRCLDCKDPKCVEACPLHIDIKSFILNLAQGDVEGAFNKISERSPFPGICGRVCQHELFCENACLLGKKLDPVAIGSLERFCSDHHRQFNGKAPVVKANPTGPKIAMVGSGPASLMASFVLAQRNYRVTVFEALHRLGGVLIYGVPPFRLPREILNTEIARLESMGVKFETDVIVGNSVSLEELFNEEGFEAVFLGTGAGLPFMLNVPGENLIGVYTANEYLTRINLMHANEFPSEDTPVNIGKCTVVIGGGNSAMDAARWSKRLGADTTILFRRGRAELRARAEEIEHAEQEGIKFEFLGAPVALYGDENGWLNEMECIRMKLGEPDSSGRPSPVPIEGSNYRIPVDTVIAAVGQAPNPTLQRTTPQLITNRGKIVVDVNRQTNMNNVFAGGDVVRGGSTVILAMSDGLAAADAIDKALKSQKEEAVGAQA
ncbi:MAG TPA: NADPH-dependent glutamate synthase [Candidatus Koribacter sp.]|jgi:glutamate synthase (NADPH/NADH) small chain